MRPVFSLTYRAAWPRNMFQSNSKMAINAASAVAPTATGIFDRLLKIIYSNRTSFFPVAGMQGIAAVLVELCLLARAGILLLRVDSLPDPIPAH